MKLYSLTVVTPVMSGASGCEVSATVSAGAVGLTWPAPAGCAALPAAGPEPGVTDFGSLPYLARTMNVPTATRPMMRTIEMTFPSGVSRCPWSDMSHLFPQ